MSVPILISTPRAGGENYLRAVAWAGGMPCPAYCPAYDRCCAGLVLCGGGDIHPALFGQQDAGSRDMDLHRDCAELALTAAFLRAGKPILGICRGHQVLNVALGGDLVQDLPEKLQTFHTRAPGSGTDRYHPVCTAQGSVLGELYGPACMVNSAHHQALGRLGEGLVPTAWSESGLAEGVELPGRPVLGIQFHPERLGEESCPDLADGGAIFRRFLAWCT